MKKIKLLFAAALLLCTAGAWSQSDVTSTYLTNAGFDDCTAETSDVAAKTIKDYSSNGWSNATKGDYTTIAVTAYGGGKKVGGSTTPSTKKDGTTVSGNTLGIIAGWADNVTLQSDDITLPVGVYTLTVDHYLSSSTSNYGSASSKFGFVTSGSSYLVSSTTFTASTWTTESVTFTLTESTTGKIQIGLTGLNKSGSGSPAVFYDDVTLTWTDPLKASKDALQAEIDKAKLCDAKEGLASAISTAEGVLASATTVAELEEALATLQAADKDAVLRYENGLADATYAAPVVTGFVVNGTFDSNVNGWSRTGGFQNNAIASNQQGAFTGNFYENWNGSAKANKMYQTITNIPNGTYRLDICAFVNTLADPNESQYVFANNDKVYLTTGDPTAYEVYTVVTTNQIEVGLEQTIATANWMGIDNVSLRYYGAGDVINDAKNASHKLAWEEAKAAAEAAVANDDYENVTGSEKTALETEIAKDEPSTADGYDAATAALISATSAFTTAKPAYDAYAEIRGVAVALGITPGAAPTTAAGAPAATNTLNVAVYNATTETNVFNVTAVYNPSWSSFGTGSGQHWSGDGSSYADEWRGDTNSSSRNATVTLPEGAYILMSAGRGSDNTVTTMSANGTTVTFASKGDTGYGIDTSGAANFSDGTYANTSGRGWEWRYIPVTLATETAVTITQTITRLSGGAWGSFSDFKILKVGVVATSGDYDDLNDAIADAEAKTLGFEDGEYAPYVNATALAKLAAAKAIDQDADNDQDVVQDLTTYLNTDANWTANSGEVNAVNTALFTTGEVTGSGWTQTQGWGQYKENVYSTSSGTFTYGELNGYTMPLKANTVYKLTFNHRAWDGSNSENGGNVSVLCGGDGLDATSFTGQGTNTTPKEETFYFRTGDAGNYVFTLNAPSGRPTFGGVTILKAVAEDLTIDEEVDYTPVKNYANVTLDRTIKADVWNTFVVPFDITNEELVAKFGAKVAVAEFSDAGASENAVTVSFTKMDTPAVTANTPVLLKGSAGTSFTFDDKIIETGDAKVDGTYLDFVGTYDASTTIASGDFFISANKLYKSSGATTISGTRAYLHAKSAGVKAMLFIDDEATSIDAINGVEAENGVIYNIAGQRMGKMQKGINIVNGKKVLY